MIVRTVEVAALGRLDGRRRQVKPTIVSLRRQFMWLVVILAVIGVLRLLAGSYLLSRFEERTVGVADGQGPTRRCCRR